MLRNDVSGNTALINKRVQKNQEKKEMMKKKDNSKMREREDYSEKGKVLEEGVDQNPAVLHED